MEEYAIPPLHKRKEKKSWSYITSLELFWFLVRHTAQTPSSLLPPNQPSPDLATRPPDRSEHRGPASPTLRHRRLVSDQPQYYHRSPYVFLVMTETRARFGPAGAPPRSCSDPRGVSRYSVF
jgi:hypothetical protein